MKRTFLPSLLIIAISLLILGQTISKKADDTYQQKQILLKLTDELTATKVKRDITVLDRMLADDFIFTNPAGLFVDKAEYLEGSRIDTAIYEPVKNYDQVVRVYGDAAVVAGSTTVKGRYEGQKKKVDFDSQIRM